MSAFVIKKDGKLKVIGSDLRSLSSYGIETYQNCYVEEYIDSLRKKELNQDSIQIQRKDVPKRWEKYTVLYKMHITQKTGGSTIYLTVANIDKDGFIREDTIPTREEELEDELYEVKKELSKTKNELSRSRSEVGYFKTQLEKLKKRGFWARLFNKE